MSAYIRLKRFSYPTGIARASLHLASCHTLEARDIACHVANMPQYPQAIHGNAMMVPTSVSEWAPYRPTIIRLYAHENMRLKDVQHIMEEEHKFRAS